MSSKNLRLGMIGKKVGMTSIFDDEGNRIGVTVLQMLPGRVLQQKTQESDGYAAIQVGFGVKRPKLVNRPEAGHFKKAGLEPEAFPREVQEIRLAAEDVEKFPVGSEMPVSFFAEGDIVDVIGVSKGKGFQGVMKRHHFAGFPASHGTHEYFRHSGSIGCRSTPGRVFRGRKMSGRMGAERVTVQNLRISKVLADEGVLLLRGPVPGAKGALILVQGAVKQPAKKIEAAAAAG